MWERIKSRGRDLVNFLGFVVSVTTFVVVVFLLFEAVTARTISIAPLLVPQELEHRGTTSVVAAQRLRDALLRFGERANALTHGPQLIAFNKLPPVTVGHSLHDDLPDFVVPAVGLSVEGIAAYIRTILDIQDRRNISGEITLLDNRLSLRLRLNGRTFYDSPLGVEPNKVDQLFAMAAGKVFEVTEPYLSAAAMAGVDPDRAVEIAKQIIAGFCSASDVKCREPREAALWHNLIGSILQDKDNLTKAMAEYRRATEIDGGFTIAHSNLAGLLQEQGDIKAAETAYREAIKSDPHFAPAHFNLANTLRAQKGHEADAESERGQAMTEYRKAIASSPSSVYAHFNFGNALLVEGRYEPDRLLSERKYEEAIEQFRWAVNLDWQNAATHYGLGRALYQLSEALPPGQQIRKEMLRQDAVDAFNQAVELAPRFGDAYYNLGLVLRRQDRRDEANTAFEKEKNHYELILRRDPSNPRAHRVLGRHLYNSGNYGGAIDEFSEAIKMEPDFTEAYRARGLAWLYEGEFDNAVSDLKIVADRSPDDLYKMLWLYLAEAQSSKSANALSDLRETAGVPKQVWPYAVVELFLDKKTKEQTLEAAGENADYKCEAHFYIGEWYLLLKRDGETARGYLKKARGTCRHEFIEYLGAEAELKRLQAN